MMIDTLITLLQTSPARFENEVLEFKEADNTFRVRDLGVYFSALSNEANLRGVPYALLVFGVSDDGTVKGTSFMREPGFPDKPSKGLQRLKRAVAEQTNNRITFRDIHEVEFEGKRVVAFEIPPATRGIPTQWAGAAWAREGESLAPLPLSKIDEIRSQPPADWAKQPVAGAGLVDLDPDAVERVREVLTSRYGERRGLIDALDDVELLDKAGITLRGVVTNAAFVLLGSPDRAGLFEGPVPRITWSLCEADGKVRAYEHFGPPFLMTVDDVLAKVRNERYRLLDGASSLVPREISEYDPWTLRELLGNAIAHQAYDLGRKINIEEFPDRVEVLNEGSFIPGTIETALRIGYRPAYYRNPFLCDAMLQAGMLDQNAMGIRTMCENARGRRMPLPTYDLSEEGRVRVVVYNHEIDPAFAGIVAADPELPIASLLALDQIQKGLPCDPDEQELLVARGMVERRAGGKLRLVRASGDVAVATPSASLRSDPSARPAPTLSEAIVEALRVSPLSRNRLAELLEQSYRNSSDFGDRVYRALKDLERDGKVVGEGGTRARVWRLRD